MSGCWRMRCRWLDRWAQTGTGCKGTMERKTAKRRWGYNVHMNGTERFDVGLKHGNMTWQVKLRRRGSWEGKQQVCKTHFARWKAERTRKLRGNLQRDSRFPGEKPCSSCCLSSFLQRKLPNDHNYATRTRVKHSKTEQQHIVAWLTALQHNYHRQTQIKPESFALIPVMFLKVNNTTTMSKMTTKVSESRQLINIVCKSQPLSPNSP